MANTAVYSSPIYHLLFVAESGQNQHMVIALCSVIHQYRTDGQVQGIGGRRTSIRTISIRPTAGGPVVEATIVLRREKILEILDYCCTYSVQKTFTFCRGEGRGEGY